MSYPLVEVKWEDAATSHGWESPEEIRKDSDDEIAITVGFLVRESQSFIWIASTVDSEGNNNARIKIPRAMIRAQREISIHAKRTKKVEPNVQNN